MALPEPRELPVKTAVGGSEGWAKAGEGEMQLLSQVPATARGRLCATGLSNGNLSPK